MSIENFRQLADYNHWANRRLYGAALAMPDEAYRRRTGVFFKSMHGTLNHLLLTDRIWLKRLTGEGEHPDRPNCSISRPIIVVRRPLSSRFAPARSHRRSISWACREACPRLPCAPPLRVPGPDDGRRNPT